jgi:hypothetical protein
LWKRGSKSNTIKYKIKIKLENGKVYAFGCNEYGQLCLGDTTDRNVPTEVKKLENLTIISGYDHGFAFK